MSSFVLPVTVSRRMRPKRLTIRFSLCRPRAPAALKDAAYGNRTDAGSLRTGCRLALFGRRNRCALGAPRLRDRRHEIDAAERRTRAPALCGA